MAVVTPTCDVGHGMSKRSTIRMCAWIAKPYIESVTICGQ